MTTDRITAYRGPVGGASIVQSAREAHEFPAATPAVDDLPGRAGLVPAEPFGRGRARAGGGVVTSIVRRAWTAPFLAGSAA